MPPGWFPEELGGMQYPKEINLKSYHKYNPEYNRRFNGYILFHFLITLILASILLFTVDQMETGHLVLCCVLIINGLLSYGALMEGKSWSGKIEYFRFTYWLFLPLIFLEQGFFIYLFMLNTLLVVSSIFWFNKLKRS